MNHWKAIAELSAARGWDAVLLSSPANRFYAAGFPSPQGDALAIVTAKGEAFYFTDSRYSEAAEACIEGASLAQVRRGRGYLTLCREVIEQCALKKMGFEEDCTTVAEWEQLRKLPVEWQFAGQALAELRIAKEAEALEAIRGAQAIAEKAFAEVLEEIKVGRTEQEIAAFLQYRMLHYGASDMSFSPIVASGANGSLPHAVPTGKPIEYGEFVTMDFGCIYRGYCSDMTRTVAVGTVTEEMERVYQTVLQAQEAGIAAARAGVTAQSVDAAARAMIAQAGYGDCFGHSFGHGIGVLVHEQPNVSPGNETLLTAGAVISAEPGIYLPKRFGVRIEDMLYLTRQGCENLTHAPKKLLHLCVFA